MGRVTMRLTAALYPCGVFSSSRVHNGVSVLLNSPISNSSAGRLSSRTLSSSTNVFALTHELPPSTPDLQFPPIPGLLALRVRRGDFDADCPTLRRWKTRFGGLNTPSETIDRGIELVGNKDSSSTQHSEAFQKACYSSTGQIVQRVRRIRMIEEGKGLRAVFIMTLSDRLSELKRIRKL